MQDSKFITLLRTLDESAMSAFYKHLKQLYGPGQIPVKVFDYIRKSYPGFRHEQKLDTGYAYQKIFQKPMEQGKDRIRLLNALSDLHLALKSFLISEKALNGPFESRFLWSVILQERGLDTEFERSVDDLSETMQELPLDDTVGFMKNMLVSYFFYFHPLLNRSREKNEVLQQCSHDLDMFYLLFRYKIACEMANINKMRPSEFKMEALFGAFDMATQAPLPNHPLIQLFRETYLVFTLDTTDQYDRTEKLLFEYAGQIDAGELHMITSFLNNYAARQTRIGKREYWKKAHQLNVFGLEHDLFTRGNAMSATQFNNIVYTAAVAGNFSWATYFIATQSHILQDDIRENIVLLAQAIVAFERKDFKETFEKLQQTGAFIDFHHAIRARMLGLASLYEVPETPPAYILGLCKTFETYLRRNRKINRQAADSTLRFTRILKKLVKRKDSRQKIRAEVESPVPVAMKGWLLEKTDSYQPLSGESK
jgi:hypothetical protein